MAERVCFFAPCTGKEPWRTCTDTGIRSMITCSNERQDDKHISLQDILDTDGDKSSVDCHKSCYSTYTSKTLIARLKSKRGHGTGTLPSEPPVRTRRSQSAEFSFQQHCLICGEECVAKDPRHSGRWRRVVQCQTIDRPGQQTFKELLLDLCDIRGDQWGRNVELRVKGASTDLPAADAQYHKCCYDRFRKMATAEREPSKPSIEDNAIRACIDYMYDNRSSTLTTNDMYDMYRSHDGQLVKKQMLAKITDYFGDEVIVLHIEGCASIIGFRDCVSQMIKLVRDDGVDGDGVDTVVRIVKAESKSISYDRDYNLSDFTFAKTVTSCSPTLLALVAGLVSDGELNKAAVSITQSIQQHITKRPNQTTLGLAVKVHHQFGSSNLVKLLNEHGYITSYDEVLRFRKSAAKFVSENGSKIHEAVGLTRRVGPIFGWFDNYDLLVCTPNGRRETHAMALEFQQHPAGILEPGDAQPGVMDITIPRLSKSSASALSLGPRSVVMQHHTAPKKVNPPTVVCTSGPSYADVCAKNASLKRALLLDVQWLNSVLHEEDPVEWSGYNVALARETTAAPNPTVYIFGPLIDAPPSHPDTVLTTLAYFEKTLGELGMETTNLSADMQLYIVGTHIKWALSPDRFSGVVLRPGGMHVMMSFLGCIGHLMKGSGIEVVVSSAYGCLTSIMNGKAWVRSLRAFRMVSSALLHDFFGDGEKTLEDISSYVEKAREHPTGRLWVDCLLLPTLIAHQFLRAEREGDWLLQQHCLKEMLCYFFAAGHWQYARYITWHLLEMDHCLPDDAKTDLLSGAHVCSHNKGWWNSVSSDMFGEQTYIKKGKLPGGLKGISLSAEQVAVWVESYHVCAHVTLTVDSMYETAEDRKTEEKHKEEGKGRMKLDKGDRRRILDELEKYSHPLKDVSCTVYNIVNGKVASSDVNVQNAVELGEQMAAAFRSSLPDGFHSRLTQRVKTMESMKCGVKVGDKSVYDMGTICMRILVVGQQRHFDLQQVFNHELCAVPPSLIDEYGCLRKGSKAVLVGKLRVDELQPADPDIVIVDASQLLYHLIWPNGGSASVLATSMKNRLSCYKCEVLVVFDRYDEQSAKDHERVRRAGEGSVEYNITISSPLPNRESIMKNKMNKKALAKVLCTFDLGQNVTMLGRDEVAFIHDEADVTMVSYMLAAVKDGKGTIRVLSDDTDVFVLLVYWCWRMQIQASVQMERWDGRIIDINATATKLGSKCLQLLGVHALSGCDTVSYPFGRGKASALKVLTSKDISGLDTDLGEVDGTLEAVMKAGHEFFAALYGVPEGISMNDARYDLYSRKSKGKPPMMKSLPPTDSNLSYHVLRAHLQTMLWKAADKQRPPSVNITDFGWDIVEGLPSPSTAPGPVAPPELMDVISCRCKAYGKACSTNICSCRSAGLSCTFYCACAGGTQCCNPLTKRDDEHVDEAWWEGEDEDKGEGEEQEADEQPGG